MNTYSLFLYFLFIIGCTGKIPCLKYKLMQLLIINTIEHKMSLFSYRNNVWSTYANIENAHQMTHFTLKTHTTIWTLYLADNEPLINKFVLNFSRSFYNWCLVLHSSEVIKSVAAFFHPRQMIKIVVSFSHSCQMIKIVICFSHPCQMIKCVSSLLHPG